jgi:fucose permease
VVPKMQPMFSLSTLSFSLVNICSFKAIFLLDKSQVWALFLNRICIIFSCHKGVEIRVLEILVKIRKDRVVDHLLDLTNSMDLRPS